MIITMTITTTTHHYAHHHHSWHHGGWGPGFWGGAAVGYGLGYGYGNWGGWGYDGGGDTYVDNSTNRHAREQRVGTDDDQRTIPPTMRTLTTSQQHARAERRTAASRRTIGRNWAS